MEKIVVDGVVITIIGLVKSQDRHGVLIATDAEVDSDQFVDFLRLHDKYNSYGNYFSTVIKGENFHGRFGQLIYSKCELNYKLRLYFVGSEGDSDEYYSGFVSRDDVLYSNMSKMIAKQELTISNLINVLYENKLLNEINAKNLISHSKEDIDVLRVKMSRQLDDLEKYLSSTHQNLADRDN